MFMVMLPQRGMASAAHLHNPIRTIVIILRKYFLRRTESPPTRRWRYLLKWRIPMTLPKVFRNSVTERPSALPQDGACAWILSNFFSTVGWPCPRIWLEARALGLVSIWFGIMSDVSRDCARIEVHCPIRAGRDNDPACALQGAIDPASHAWRERAPVVGATAQLCGLP